MTNIERINPAIPMKLDRDRVLLLNLKGLRLAEEKLGKSLFKLIKWTDMGFADASLILWAALLHEDPELTRDKSDELFDLVNVVDNFQTLIAFVETVIDRAMPNLTAEEIAAVDAQKKKLQRAVGAGAAMAKRKAN